MSESEERQLDGLIPTGIAKCCREWIVPVGFGAGGRCGLCHERPTFKHMLPESDWVRA